MSLIGTEIGVAEESKSNVQEKSSPKSGHFYESMDSIEITRDKGPKVKLKGGNLFLITPKEDRVLEIVTDIKKRFPGETKIPFSINKLEELSETEKLRYTFVGLLKVKEGAQLTGISTSGTLWPPNVNEKKDSFYISNRYKGSGCIYIYIIDSSYISDVGASGIRFDGVLKNSVILSNIIKQPIRFVSK